MHAALGPDRELSYPAVPHGDRKPLFNALIRDAELTPEEVRYLRDLLKGKAVSG